MPPSIRLQKELTVVTDETKRLIAEWYEHIHFWENEHASPLVKQNAYWTSGRQKRRRELIDTETRLARHSKQPKLHLTSFYRLVADEAEAEVFWVPSLRGEDAANFAAWMAWLEAPL
jgi:hypothetical protein